MPIYVCIFLHSEYAHLYRNIYVLHLEKGEKDTNMKKIFNPLVRVISSRKRPMFNYQQQQCHIIIPPASTILNTMGMVKDVVAKGDDIFASLGINTAKRELNATVAMVNAHLVCLNRQGIIRPQEHRIIKIYIQIFNF